MQTKFKQGDRVILKSNKNSDHKLKVGDTITLELRDGSDSNFWTYEESDRACAIVFEGDIQLLSDLVSTELPAVESKDPNVKISEYYYSVYKCRDLLRQVSEVPHSLSIFSNGEAGSIKAMLDRLETRIEVLEELQHFLKQS